METTAATTNNGTRVDGANARIHGVDDKNTMAAANGRMATPSIRRTVTSPPRGSMPHTARRFPRRSPP